MLYQLACSFVFVGFWGEGEGEDNGLDYLLSIELFTARGKKLSGKLLVKIYHCCLYGILQWYRIIYVIGVVVPCLVGIAFVSMKHLSVMPLMFASDIPNNRSISIN